MLECTKIKKTIFTHITLQIMTQRGNFQKTLEDVATGLLYCWTKLNVACMSHPILRIQLNALTHVCPGINHTHKLTNYKRVSSQCFLHHDSNNTQSYTSQRKIKDNSLTWNTITRKVNWLTTSLIILRKFLIPVVICYPSGIFIQIKKINKHKYFPYLTR